MFNVFVEEFAEYRKAEVEKAVSILNELMAERVTYDFFQGAMKMLKAIVSLPKDYAKTKPQEERADMLARQMLVDFQAKMIRRSLEDGDQ